MKKKLSYFNEEMCEVCNNGLISEIDRLINTKGFNPRSACHEIASDIRLNTGDEIYTAEQLRDRYGGIICQDQYQTHS